MKNRVITVICLLAAIALVALGVAKGQQTAVYKKAVRICLECVGIG